MKELFNIFEALGYEGLYFLQGTLNKDEYPQKYFTFQNFDTPNISFYDNKDTRYCYKVNVYLYMQNTLENTTLLYQEMDRFIQLAKAKGFVVEGRAKDAPTDTEKEIGRYITVNIIHKED